MSVPMLPANGGAPQPGGANGHRYLARTWIPGHGYHYIYGPGHNIRTPNMLQRVKDLESKVQQTPAPPTAPPIAPPADTGQGLEGHQDPDQAGAQVAPRALDRRPGSRARNFFAVGEAGDSPDVAHFVHAARGTIREAVLLYLHERCVCAPLMTVWQTVQPRLADALDAGVRAALDDPAVLHALYKATRGNTAITAHLIAATRWTAIAEAICRAAHCPQYAGELAHIARPRDGFPAYDAAMRTLADLRDQGAIES